MPLNELSRGITGRYYRGTESEGTLPVDSASHKGIIYGEGSTSAKAAYGNSEAKYNYYPWMVFDASAGTVEDNPSAGHVGTEIKPISISFLFLISY